MTFELTPVVDGTLGLTPEPTGTLTDAPEHPGTLVTPAHGRGILSPLHPVVPGHLGPHPNPPISAPFIASVTLLYLPLASPDQFFLPFIDGSGSTVYTPALFEFVAPVPFIDSTTAVHALVLDSAGFIVPLIASATVVYDPASLNGTIPNPFIASATVVRDLVLAASADSVLPPFIPSVSVVDDPVVESAGFVAPFISSATVVYQPSANITSVPVPFRATATVVYALAQLRGTVTAGFIASVTSTHAISKMNVTVPLGLIPSATVVYQPAVAPRSTDIVPFIDSVTVVDDLTLTATANVSPPFIASVSVANDPTITSSASFANPFITTVTSVYALSVAASAESVIAELIPSVTVVNALTVNLLSFPLGMIPSVSSVYALAPFGTQVAVPFIGSVTVARAPTLSSHATVTAPLIASATVVRTPVVSAKATVTPGLIASHTIVRAPTISGVRNWPASFLTGPLGTNNVLPTTPTGVFLANQPGGNGVTALQSRAEFAGRQVSAQGSGRSGPLDVFHFHYDGSLSASYGGVAGCENPTDVNGAAPGGITQEAYAIANGSYPMVAWMPQYTVAQINAGTADAIFTKLATYWATYAPNRIVWRPWAEFNLPSAYGIYAGGGSPSVLPSDFRTAWHRVVNLVKAIAPNVAFVYNFDEGNNRDYIASCYPGDAYVDWVASDSYNICSVTAPSCFSTPLHSGFAEWWELFNYTHGTGLGTGACLGGAGVCRTWSNYDIFGAGVATRNSIVCVGGDLPAELPTQKPYFVAETGCKYDSTDATTMQRKGQFWQRTLTLPFGVTAMPNCIGVSHFDADVHSADNYNWMVDSNASVVNTAGSPDAATLAAWAAAAGSPLLKGKA